MSVGEAPNPASASPATAGRLPLIALLVTAAACLGAAAWWFSQPAPVDAPPDRDETEEMMREIGYVQ